MTKTKAKSLTFDAKTGYPFKVGDTIFIRTVTMYQIGNVAHIGPDSITLTDASWVADVGRLGESLATGNLLEFEKTPGWITVGRGAIIDIYPWGHALPTETK